MPETETFTDEDSCQYCGTQWNEHLRFLRSRNINYLRRQRDADGKEIEEPQPTCEVCYHTFLPNMIAYEHNNHHSLLAMAIGGVANIILTELRSR